MKKILCFLSRNDYMALEAVTDYASSGDEVLFLGCDKTIGICHENDSASAMRCRFCHSLMKRKVNELCNRFPDIKVKYTTVGREATKGMINHSDQQNYKYENISEIKAITYKGVNIGFAAFSDFVSCTRNVTPSFNDYFHKYIDMNLRRGMLLTDVVETILKREKYDLVIFHNGRFVNVKPLYDLARIKHIDFVATELAGGLEGWRLKNYFFNGIPHDVEECRKKMELAWKRAGLDREKIGRKFFESRYHSIAAGDSNVYTNKQQLGKLPEGFDATKRNIVIFNSSEDEFVAISKEYDEGMLFPSQYLALKTLFEHYKGNENFHFYLRIHPNLANIQYRSHLSLYELKYSNVTIIPPQSPISSYTLMENAEKVVVFNSTIGVESAYWGKPVIGLNHFVYDIVWHMPSSKEDLFSMIDDEKLAPLSNKEDCLKIACYLYKYHTDKFVNYPTYRKFETLLGRGWYTLSQFTILGSPVFATAAEQFACLISRKLWHDEKFSNIAENTK